MHESDESGRSEVYVRPFPDVGVGRWQISLRRGTEPVWAYSGQELFYRSEGNLMVTDVATTPTFAPGEAQACFRCSGMSPLGSTPDMDVAADDQRFVMIQASGFGMGGDLIVVENFFKELKAKLGN